MLVSELRQGCYVPEIHPADKERLTNLYSAGVMLLLELCRDKEMKITRFVIIRDTNKVCSGTRVPVALKQFCCFDDFSR